MYVYWYIHIYIRVCVCVCIKKASKEEEKTVSVWEVAVTGGVGSFMDSSQAKQPLNWWELFENHLKSLEIVLKLYSKCTYLRKSTKSQGNSKSLQHRSHFPLWPSPSGCDESPLQVGALPPPPTPLCYGRAGPRAGRVQTWEIWSLLLLGFVLFGRAEPLFIYFFPLYSTGTKLHIHVYIAFPPVVVLRCKYLDIVLNATQQDLIATQQWEEKVCTAKNK